MPMDQIGFRPVTAEDYDGIFALWNSTEQSRRALNPVDDSREGIGRYLRRNPATCFLAYTEGSREEERKIVGVIHRLNDCEDKWIVSLSGEPVDPETIRRLTEFQEKYYMGELYT